MEKIEHICRPEDGFLRRIHLAQSIPTEYFTGTDKIVIVSKEKNKV